MTHRKQNVTLVSDVAFFDLAAQRSSLAVNGLLAQYLKIYSVMFINIIKDGEKV